MPAALCHAPPYHLAEINTDQSEASLSSETPDKNQQSRELINDTDNDSNLLMEIGD